jgi:uncharacterized membrane protein YhaH (DUF805 family)
MPKFIARSHVADLLGRSWNIVLLLLLLPFILVFACLPGIDRPTRSGETFSWRKTGSKPT